MLPPPLRLLAFALALAACNPTTRPDPTTPRAEAQATGTDTAALVRYTRQSGRTVDVASPSDSTVTVRVDGETVELARAASASGTRYVGGTVEWWPAETGARAEATLFRRAADGSTGERLDGCTRA